MRPRVKLVKPNLRNKFYSTLSSPIPKNKALIQREFVVTPAWCLKMWQLLKIVR